MNLKRLLIRLHSSLETCDWLLQTSPNHCQMQTNVGINTIPTTTQDMFISVFVPNTHIILKETHLATNNHKRLIHAIPYALEESLTDDIKQLHFAFTIVEKGKLQIVAVVSKEKLTHWLDLLATHNIHPDQVIPEVFLLPVTDNYWHIRYETEYALIREGKLTGFAIQKEYWQDAIKMAIDNAKQKPSTLIVENTEPAELHISHIDNIPIAVEVKPNENILIWFNKNFSNTFFINLLQGEFQTKLRRTPGRIWKIAGILTACLIAINLIGQLIAFVYLTYQNHILQNQISQIYYVYFPQATSVIEPRLRMRQMLHQYTGNVSDQGFLSIMAKLGPVYKKYSMIQIHHMRFQNNQLYLNFTIEGFLELNAFYRALQKAGLLVKQTTAATSDNTIQVEYIVRLIS